MPREKTETGRSQYWDPSHNIIFESILTRVDM